MSRNARRSIGHRASVSGTGLHTGAQTEATFLPAPAGQGIVFRRVDLKGKPEVPALLSEVEAIERRTAIGKGDTTIHTVEHLLAAVAAHEIDDLIVELSGPRSEEHTSELQSRLHLVCRLLLEKKKKKSY